MERINEHGVLPLIFICEKYLETNLNIGLFQALTLVSLDFTADNMRADDSEATYTAQPPVARSAFRQLGKIASFFPLSLHPSVSNSEVRPVQPAVAPFASPTQHPELTAVYMLWTDFLPSFLYYRDRSRCQPISTRDPINVN